MSSKIYTFVHYNPNCPSQPSSSDVYAALNQPRCPLIGGQQPHLQLTDPLHHDQSQNIVTSSGGAGNLANVYSRVDKQTSATIHTHPTEVPALGAVRSTIVPLHSPQPVSATSNSPFGALHTSLSASSQLLDKEHGYMADFEEGWRTSAPGSHDQDYRTNFAPVSQDPPSADCRTTAHNVPYQQSIGNRWRPTPTTFSSPSAIQDIPEPAPKFQAPNEGSPLVSQPLDQRAYLPPLGSGADLVRYSVALDRELLRMSWKPSETLLYSDPPGAGNHQSEFPPTEKPPEAENMGQKKTSRESLLRDVSDGVGSQISDPVNITGHDKRNYIDSLEHHVLWLRSKCELSGVDAGEIRQLSGRCLSEHSGLDTRSIMMMIVRIITVLRKDRSDFIQEEGDVNQLELDWFIVRVTHRVAQLFYLRELVSRQSQRGVSFGSAQIMHGV